MEDITHGSRWQSKLNKEHTVEVVAVNKTDVWVSNQGLISPIDITKFLEYFIKEK